MDPGPIRFFANSIDRVEPSKAQPLAREGASFVLTLPVASTLAGSFGKLAGVVTATNGFAADVRAATIDVAVNGAVVPGPKAALAAAPALDLSPPPSTGDGMSLALALAFALVGGLILNLMPCVFPVLSLKVLGFATHHDARSTLKHEAIAFAGGVVVTFVALGLLLSALRAAGEQLGWGFQLQSPRGRHRARDPFLRAGAEPVRCLRIRHGGAVGRRRMVVEESRRRRVRLRRAGRRRSRRRARRRSWERRSASRSPAALR